MDDIAISRRAVIQGAGLAVAMGEPALGAGRRPVGPGRAGAIVRRDFRVDVSEAVGAGVSGGKPQWLGARVVAPAHLASNGTVPVVICTHGGTFDKRYYDIRVPGRTGYSMAERFAAAGAIVVAFDMLGISGSSRPENADAVSRFVQATALDAAARSVFDQLVRGRLDRRIPALPRIRRIGLAHSMGVMVTVVQQANHHTFEQLLLLGYSIKGVELRHSAIPNIGSPQSQFDKPDNLRRLREGLRREYYLPDVPADVIAADEAAAAPPPQPAGREAVGAGVALAEAGMIREPVFLGYGERDISPDPRAELTAFSSSKDLTLALFPDVAHAHNLANGRDEVWRRSLAWIGSFA